MPYYNLAVPGSGIDLLAYNLTTFLKLKKPKYIVVQWPELARTYREHNSNVMVYGNWSTDYLFRDMLKTDAFEHFGDLLKTIIRNTIDVIEIDVECVDYGRDLKHPGINSHYSAAESILSRLNNLGQ